MARNSVAILTPLGVSLQQKQTITEYILTGGIRFLLVLSNFPRSRYTGVAYTATLFTTMHGWYN